MEKTAYRYAQMKPDQLEKLRQAEKDMGRFTQREIVLIAYEKESADR